MAEHRNVDNRSEDEKVAAVRASLTMAGQSLTPQNEARIRRIFRGEITGDEAALEFAEEYGHHEHAQRLRERIAKAKAQSENKAQAGAKTQGEGQD